MPLVTLGVRAEVERVADRDDVVTDLQLVGAAELGGREARHAVGLHDGDVVAGHRADEPWPRRVRRRRSRPRSCGHPRSRGRWSAPCPSAVTTMPDPAASPLRHAGVDRHDGRPHLGEQRPDVELRAGDRGRGPPGVVTDVAWVVTGQSSRFHSAATVTPPATIAPTRPPIRAARMPPRPNRPPGPWSGDGAGAVGPVQRGLYAGSPARGGPTGLVGGPGTPARLRAERSASPDPSSGRPTVGGGGVGPPAVGGAGWGQSGVTGAKR